MKSINSKDRKNEYYVAPHLLKYETSERDAEYLLNADIIDVPHHKHIIESGRAA